MASFKHPRFVIRKGMFIKQKLTGHVCRIIKQDNKCGGRAWKLTTPKGTVHTTNEGTILKFYDPA